MRSRFGNVGALTADGKLDALALEVGGVEADGQHARAADGRPGRPLQRQWPEYSRRPGSSRYSEYSQSPHADPKRNAGREGPEGTKPSNGPKASTVGREGRSAPPPIAAARAACRRMRASVCARASARASGVCVRAPACGSLCVRGGDEGRGWGSAWVCAWVGRLEAQLARPLLGGHVPHQEVAVRLRHVVPVVDEPATLRRHVALAPRAAPPRTNGPLAGCAECDTRSSKVIKDGIWRAGAAAGGQGAGGMPASDEDPVVVHCERMDDALEPRVLVPHLPRLNGCLRACVRVCVRARRSCVPDCGGKEGGSRG